MFKKKNCKRCGNKINGRYDFCPHCGNPLNENFEEDWGMLGKNDFIPLNNEINFPVGLNRIFSSLIKNLGKELNRELGTLDKKTVIPKEKVRKRGVSIRISTSGNKPPEIEIDSFGDDQEAKNRKEKKEIPLKKLPQKNLRKIANLPKEEPVTDIKRLSNKVVYEIEIPGVKSIEDISIIKLENSIEIKALAKDKVYFKLIPINLPITNYNLSKGKLVLELATSD